MDGLPPPRTFEASDSGGLGGRRERAPQPPRERCVATEVVEGLFPTTVAWYRGEPFEIAQLVYPDRNGFMPYEAGFDQRMRFAQPLLGSFVS